jgi:hypothetical protein
MGSTVVKWFFGFVAAGIVAFTIVGASGGHGALGGAAAVTTFLCIAGASLIVYFVPAIIAADRRHRQATAIFFLDLFLGWSLLGWVAALVWACTNPVEVSVSGPTHAAPAPAAAAPGVGEKACPRCAETVKAAALVCRYCGHEFTSAS